MLTGTPLDLTPLGPVFQGLGMLYWFIVLGTVGLVLWWFKGWRSKAIALTLALAVLVLPVAYQGFSRWSQHRAAKARFEAAQEHFALRCKSAGEKIVRAVENVDGIVLLKLRPSDINYADQFRLDDPYGHDCSGEDCVAGYLFDYRMLPIGGGGVAPSNKRLYRYVEVPDADRQFQHFEKSSATSELSRRVVASPSAEYVVEWRDISTREDRVHWIAGGAIRVTDLRTKEVIAERTGYLMDQGQGNTAGFRTPWTWARSYGPACPPVAGHNLTFVTKVLKPRQSEN
jgi:hypothetical protein